MDQEAERFAAITQSHATVADKIRALSAAGVPRADIARFLGKRYQHVRNVLEGDAQSSGGYVLGKADLSGIKERGSAFERDDDDAYIERRSAGVFWLEVKPDGTLPLAQEIVDALSALPGRRIYAQVKDDGVILRSSEAAANRARTMVRRAVQGGSVVDEFLAGRRAM